MRTKLSYLSEEQAALAQNVANVDTPGYKARDVAEPDFKKLINTFTSASGNMVQKLPLQVTNANHINHGIMQAGDFATIRRATTDELKPDGNNVSIEGEMSKIALNQAEYQKVLGMYGKMITMFKTAIGNPSGGA